MEKHLLHQIVFGEPFDPLVNHFSRSSTLQSIGDIS
uniref:Uncharacterized protein n=1 Tax=Nelumbo nucifera TaxID=4432 RepID=A0A822XUG3_NELNU|nr:TPA_asm: hypothetical protein HUJ06_025473 [Nelumbo nucifera]